MKPPFGKSNSGSIGASSFSVVVRGSEIVSIASCIPWSGISVCIVETCSSHIHNCLVRIKVHVWIITFFVESEPPGDDEGRRQKMKQKVDIYEFPKYLTSN